MEKPDHSDINNRVECKYFMTLQDLVEYQNFSYAYEFFACELTKGKIWSLRYFSVNNLNVKFRPVYLLQSAEAVAQVWKEEQNIIQTKIQAIRLVKF